MLMSKRTPQDSLECYQVLMECAPQNFQTHRDVAHWLANRGHLNKEKKRRRDDEWRKRQEAKRDRGIVEARRITVKVRREVLAEGFCVYCEVGKATVVDHIVPVSRGGNRRRSNLAPACERCNDEKGDFTPAEWREWRLAHGMYWPPISRRDARRLHYGLLDMMDPESRAMVREANDRLILKIESGEVVMAEISASLDPWLARYTAA